VQVDGNGHAVDNKGDLTFDPACLGCMLELGEIDLTITCPDCRAIGTIGMSCPICGFVLGSSINLLD
jgi:hypothetical protein